MLNDRYPPTYVNTKVLPSFDELCNNLVVCDVLEKFGNSYRVIPGEEEYSVFEILLEPNEAESDYPDLDNLKKQMMTVGITIVVRKSTDEEMAIGAAPNN